MRQGATVSLFHAQLSHDRIAQCSLTNELLSKCKYTNNQYSAEAIQNIALGSLLHLIQDSFSSSHVLREGSAVGVSKISGAGTIKQFGIYTAQDEKSHGHADINIEDLTEHTELSLTDLSVKIIEFAVNQRGSGSDSWADAEMILEKAFAIRSPSEKPGDIGYGITIRSSGPAEAGR